MVIIQRLSQAVVVRGSHITAHVECILAFKHKQKMRPGCGSCVGLPPPSAPLIEMCDCVLSGAARHSNCRLLYVHRSVTVCLPDVSAHLGITVTISTEECSVFSSELPGCLMPAYAARDLPPVLHVFPDTSITWETESTTLPFRWSTPVKTGTPIHGGVWDGVTSIGSPAFPILSCAQTAHFAKE